MSNGKDAALALGGLGLMAAMLAKPEINGTWFNGKEVKLDGYKFKGCRFDSCQLVVSSTNFVLDHCYIDEHSVIIYSGEIMKIIQLFNSRNAWMFENQPAFAPKKNQDMTISIGA